jgi:hypothetical protein
VINETLSERLDFPAWSGEVVPIEEGYKLLIVCEEEQALDANREDHPSSEC